MLHSSSSANPPNVGENGQNSFPSNESSFLSQDEDLLICREFAQNLKFIDEQPSSSSSQKTKSNSNFDPCFHTGITHLEENEKDQDISKTNSSPKATCQKTFDSNAHSCSYCAIQDPRSLVKCITCNRWFCNIRGLNSSASHAVNHLVRSRHKEVSLHPEGPLGECLLECYNCGCKNVFLLGFIPALADSTVVLLCRQPCASSSGSGAASGWDCDKWQPLIEDKAFLPWLVAGKPADESELRAAKAITVAQMNRIEDAWREQPQACIQDIDELPEAQMPETVALSYANAHEYAQVFHPLVTLEAENEKRMKEAAKQENLIVRWETGPSGQRTAWFILSRHDAEVRIALGDEVQLSWCGNVASKSSSSSKRWCGLGVISRVSPTAGDEIAVELDPQPANSSSSMDITLVTCGFTLEFIWKPTPYTRMHNALKSFARESASISPALRKCILARHSSNAEEEEDQEQGKFSSSISPQAQILPSSLNVPSLEAAELNHSQRSAILQAINQPLSLIQGPPGTGKTLTSATLIYHLVKLGMGPILVCAPSNVAVDQLAAKVHATGVKVLRLVSKARESIESPVSFLTLHEQVKRTNLFADLTRLRALKEEKGSLSPSDEDKLRLLIGQTEKVLIQSADVICCTAVGAGDLRLVGSTFKTVIFDEATQAREPECLIPLTHGAERAVLIGDHQQLGPVIMCKKAAKAGFSQSMFERLVLAGLKPFRLQVQYRMHPCLSEFPSNAFYEGSLQNGVTAADRTPSSHAFPWPQPDTPMFFHVNFGHEEISSSGTSYLNRTEAISCEKMVTKFLKNGVSPSSIGIITPYEGQRAFLMNWMQMNGPLMREKYAEIEVASVDAFQGREKDYIILSCVRSNDHLGIGFLSDFRRLNVALTRARYGLIVLGNARVLSRHALWYSLLQSYKARGLLVEGPVSNLRHSLVTLLQPRGGGVASTTNYQSRSSSSLKDSEKKREEHFSCLTMGTIDAQTVGKDQFEVFDAYSQLSIHDEVVYRPSSFLLEGEINQNDDGFGFDSGCCSLGRNDFFAYESGSESTTTNYSQSSQYSEQSEHSSMTFNKHP